MPWALFAYGRSKPPKTRFRRFLWACAVFLFCAALLPFLVVGGVRQWIEGTMPDAVFTTLLAVGIAAGAGVAIHAFIDIGRERAAERRAAASVVAGRDRGRRPR